jgi:hypothetical protein
MELTGFASDNFRLEKLQIRTNDARRWKDYSDALNTESGSFSIIVDTSVLDIGSNTIWVRAEDIFGNEFEESVTIQITGSSDSGTDEDSVDSVSEFLLYSRTGNLLCGILFFIIIIVAAAVMYGKRRR